MWFFPHGTPFYECYFCAKVVYHQPMHSEVSVKTNIISDSIDDWPSKRLQVSDSAMIFAHDTST